MGLETFIQHKATKITLFILNVACLIIIPIVMGIQGVNPDTRKEFNGNITIITVFSVVLMLSWWGLSSALFAGSPEATTAYMFFMMAFLMALTFISISIATMIKV